jgi:hypothetical protein
MSLRVLIVGVSVASIVAVKDEATPIRANSRVCKGDGRDALRSLPAPRSFEGPARETPFSDLPADIDVLRSAVGDSPAGSDVAVLGSPPVL